MKTKVMYLDRLISHLNALEVEMDERTRWILLYNAREDGYRYFHLAGEREVPLQSVRRTTRRIL